MRQFENLPTSAFIHPLQHPLGCRNLLTRIPSETTYLQETRIARHPKTRDVGTVVVFFNVVRQQHRK
jgi:hypothetical protein